MGGSRIAINASHAVTGRGIKNADVQDPDSTPWRDDPWPHGTSQALRSVRDVDGTELHNWAPRARISRWRPDRTNSPEDFASLMNDLESKIFGRFHDDTSCILVMATTPRWVPSGRTSRSGGNAVGKGTTHSCVATGRDISLTYR